MCGYREFFPLGGPAGRRTVHGIVYRHGMAQRRIAVARFWLPRISLLPPAPKVRIVRTRGGIGITFTRVRGAARYALAVKISDGRAISRVLPRSGSVFIAGVRSRLTARAMVWAITPTVIVGKSGTAYSPARSAHAHHPPAHRRR